MSKRQQATAKAQKVRKKRGPEAERVKIKGDWKEAVKQALKAPPKKK